jgi:hypothetical protein
MAITPKRVHGRVKEIYTNGRSPGDSQAQNYGMIAKIQPTPPVGGCEKESVLLHFCHYSLISLISASRENGTRGLFLDASKLPWRFLQSEQSRSIHLLSAKYSVYWIVFENGFCIVQ